MVKMAVWLIYADESSIFQIIYSSELIICK